MAKNKGKESCCCCDDEATDGAKKPAKGKKVKKEKKSAKKKLKKDKKKAATLAAESAASSESCCCGGPSDEANSDCCSDSSYSCKDDPYRGPKKTVVVDFLFLDLSCCDRCQGADERVAKAVERCRPVLEACGYNLVLNQVYVETPDLAERYRFESSPTVRVNGVDVCPSIEENDCACCSDISDTPVTCRVFPFNNTYYEVPPTDMLVRGIMEVVLQGQKAPSSSESYVIPQNLVDFYEGRDRKEAKKTSGCCC